MGSGVAGDASTAIDVNGNVIAVWAQSDGTRNNAWANRYTPSAGWGTATLIETDNAGTATTPQIAMDGSGNAVAVWTQSDGTRDNVWANRYTVGSGWGTAALIETDNLGNASEVKLAVNAAGQAQAVWAQSDGVRTNIWANRYTPGSGAGTGWGTATLLETDNLGAAGAPQIALDSSGNAVAIWQQSSGSRINVWANRFVQGAWGTAQRIENNENNLSDPSIAPQLAMDTNGNAMAVWTQISTRTFGNTSVIWANRFTASTGWASAVPIDSQANIRSLNPQIAMDASGNLLAIWSSTRADLGGPLTTIHANRYTAGSGWGTSQELLATASTATSLQGVRFRFATNAQGKEPVLVWADSSNFWSLRYTPGAGWGSRTLVFPDFRSGTPDSNLLSKFALNFDANGNAVAVFSRLDGLQTNLWANTFSTNPVAAEPPPAAGVKVWRTPGLIETDTANSFTPKLVTDTNGNMLAVWRTDIGIWANRYIPSTGWGTATSIHRVTSVSGPLQLALDASGNAVATWTQPGPTGELWASRYSAGSWGAATQIASGTPSDVRLAVQPDGGVIALWSRFENNLPLWASRYTPGVGWSANLPVSGLTTRSEHQLAIDSRGNALAVWIQPGATSQSVWFSRLAAGSTTWTAPARVENVTNSQTLVSLALAFDANDNALVTWGERGLLGFVLWAAPYTPAGGWGSPVRGTGPLADTISSIATDFDGAGNALVVWATESFTNGAQQISSFAYTASGGWGSATQIGNTTGPNVRIVKAGSDRLAFWQIGQNNCLSSRLKPGTGWTPVAGLFDDFRTGGSTGCPELAYDASGNGVAVWSRFDGVQTNVWSNTYR